MNTYIITRHYDGNDNFINASTDKDMIIKQLLLMSLEQVNITILKENNEQIDFIEYMKNKEHNKVSCIDTKKLSLEETPADILVNRILYLIKYLEDKIDKKGLEKITEILYGKNNIQ